MNQFIVSVLNEVLILSLTVVILLFFKIFTILNSFASKEKYLNQGIICKGEEVDGIIENLYSIATEDMIINILIIKFANDALVIHLVQYTLSVGSNVDRLSVFNT